MKYNENGLWDLLCAVYEQAHDDYIHGRDAPIRYIDNKPLPRELWRNREKIIKDLSQNTMLVVPVSSFEITWYNESMYFDVSDRCHTYERKLRKEDGSKEEQRKEQCKCTHGRLCKCRCNGGNP